MYDRVDAPLAQFSLSEAKPRISALYYTRLLVARWVTNTINDQFDRNAILTVYM